MISITKLDDPRLALSSLKARTDIMHLATFSNVTIQVPEISQFSFFQSQQ